MSGRSSILLPWTVISMYKMPSILSILEIHLNHLISGLHIIPSQHQGDDGWIIFRDNSLELTNWCPRSSFLATSIKLTLGMCSINIISTSPTPCGVWILLTTTTSSPSTHITPIFTLILTTLIICRHCSYWLINWSDVPTNRIMRRRGVYLRTAWSQWTGTCSRSRHPAWVSKPQLSSISSSNAVGIHRSLVFCWLLKSMNLRVVNTAQSLACSIPFHIFIVRFIRKTGRFVKNACYPCHPSLAYTFWEKIQ